MRHFSLTILLILSSVSLSIGQNEPLKVPFVAYWAIGDTFNFTISKIKSSWNDGKLNQTDTTQYVARFEVLDSTDNSYRIRWSNLETLIQTENLPSDINQALTNTGIKSITYRTNELGAFVELEDWEQIAERMKIVLEKAKANLQGELSPDFDAEKIIRPIRQIYTSKQGLEKNVFKELQYFHFPFGSQFTVGDTLVSEQQLNMPGMEPIKGLVKLYIEKVDPENAYCLMKHDMELDPEEMVRALRKVFKEMGLDSDEINEAMEDARYEIKDRNTYEYIVDPGIPIRLEIKRESVIVIAGVNGYSEEIMLIEWFGE